jgi:hypothetical protein
MHVKLKSARYRLLGIGLITAPGGKAGIVFLDRSGNRTYNIAYAYEREVHYGRPFPVGSGFCSFGFSVRGGVFVERKENRTHVNRYNFNPDRHGHGRARL